MLVCEDVLRLICGNVQQSGSVEEKQSLYESKNDWNMHSVGILLMVVIESMVKVRRMLKKECYLNFAWRKNCVCKIHGLRVRQKERQY